jgi:hypothetical protein
MKLDKADNIAPTAAPMAVEDVLAGVDVKGRLAFRMQRA